ncbi:hypothetical protein MFLAVUS_003878 [Mucor flavus]|uniref:Thioredoxin domain-containing protein n=1 Tax=Mucor flavus TaxID=439312 RepID=A0ABP9YUE6_9FUNG
MTGLNELRQRLLHPYYVLQLAYGLSYVVTRSNQLLGQSFNLEETEPRTFCILFVMSVWKCFVAATAEELCSVFIFIYWRFGFWSSVLYAVGWIVLSSVFPQPWYRGPTKIFELNEAAFRDKVQLKKPTTVPVDEIKGPRITELDANEKEVKKPAETKKPEIDSKYWIVMLYANWSVTCLNFEPVLAKLSIEYDLPHLKFGQIDIDVYPNLAEEFGVSKDPASFDLPTLILFQQGKEIRRLPELTMPKEGTQLTKVNAAKDAITRLGWNKKSSTVVTAFQLEKIANEKIN